jgi:hypothetical protein
MTTQAPANHISTVRQALLDTIRDLRDTTKPMDIARARVISEVAQTVINSARVEVDYLKATGQTQTPFLEVPPDALPGQGDTSPSGYTQGVVSRLPGVTRHRIKD